MEHGPHWADSKSQAPDNGPLSLRPLSIFSVLVRAWDSLRAGEVRLWLRRRVPAALIGFQPHSECADAAVATAILCEAAGELGECARGICLDLA